MFISIAIPASMASFIGNRNAFERALFLLYTLHCISKQDIDFSTAELVCPLLPSELLNYSKTLSNSGLLGKTLSILITLKHEQSGRH